MKKTAVALVIALLLPIAAANAQSLSTRVEVPETVNAHYASATGKTNIYVDAVTVVPDAEKIPTYEVKQRIFPAEEVAKVADVLIGEGEWANMEDTGHLRFTENLEPAYHAADAEYSGGVPYECLLSSLTEEKHWVCASYEDTSMIANPLSWVDLYYDHNGGNNSSRNVGTPEDARAQADAAIAALWPEMSFHSIDEKLNNHWGRTSSYGGPYDYGYRIYYQRVLSGIPITPVAQDGSPEAMSRGEYYSWLPYEKLRVDVGAGGIFQIIYYCPIAVLSANASDTEVLPFSSIMDVFAKASVEKLSLFEEGKNNVFYVDRITLGYMCLPMASDPDRYETIPVWDFFGTRTIDEEVYDYPLDSFITINATSGAVIWRDPDSIW